MRHYQDIRLEVYDQIKKINVHTMHGKLYLKFQAKGFSDKKRAISGHFLSYKKRDNSENES